MGTYWQAFPGRLSCHASRRNPCPLCLRPHSLRLFLRPLCWRARHAGTRRRYAQNESSQSHSLSGTATGGAEIYGRWRLARKSRKTQPAYPDPVLTDFTDHQLERSSIRGPGGSRIRAIPVVFCFQYSLPVLESSSSIMTSTQRPWPSFHPSPAQPAVSRSTQRRDFVLLAVPRRNWTQWRLPPSLLRRRAAPSRRAL